MKEEVKQTQPARLRVYRKQSDPKYVQNGSAPFWYSATRADGHSVRCVFKGALVEKVPDEPAFEIYDIIGNAKMKEIIKEGETYQNYTYYIIDCKFDEIPGDELPL